MIAELLAVATALHAAVASPAPQARPFQVGERATYDVSYWLAGGSGSLEVVGIDTVRGRAAYHFRFVISGKAPFYSLTDTLNSWVDTATMHSLRFSQDQLEKDRKRVRRWEIFPETQEYTDGVGRARKPSVPKPLDDIAMLYFIRSQQLEVGKTLSFPHYFRPEANPITLRVLRRETVRVKAGRFPAIVVQPVIKSKSGLFAEDAGSLVWISDDSARTILQIKLKGPITGTVTMQLQSYRPSYLPAVQERRGQ